jgi:thioesterase domain-containing protein
MIQQIQKRSLGSVAIPLFLFHDASGTISSYYALGPLERDIYAIADSHMESDTCESFQEMSRRHDAAIKLLIPKGRILVGGKNVWTPITMRRLTEDLGWSLGGMIALQVAWVFARDLNVQVDGIIMVDSPFIDYGHVVYPLHILPP